MSSSKHASTLPFLPQEILVQILSKLPAKSLVRFRCVSKFLCSLVVDHPFADLHRKWSLTLPSRMSILIFFSRYDRPKIKCYYKINYPQENQGMLQVNSLDYMDEGDLSTDVYLRSAVNGMLCFCRNSRGRDDIVIHNLSTRHHISLPTTCSLPLNSHQRMSVWGLLGFDSVSRRYKVLKSVTFIDQSDYRVKSVKHSVFTLGVDKSWREIGCYPSFQPHAGFHYSYLHMTVHIDGVIYSLILDDDYIKFQIVAFDVAAENFRTIPSPPWDDPPCYLTVGLMEVEGRLAIVDSYKSCLCYFMRIWILEESMIWKKHMIPIPIPLEECQSENFNNICLLFFTANHVGEIAVLVRLTEYGSVLFYNFRRQSWRTFDICRFFRSLSRAVMWSMAMHFIMDNVF